MTIGLFVLCIYKGIFAANPVGDYVKSVPVMCQVLEVGPTARGPAAQQLYIDCESGLNEWRLSNNKLNWKKGWRSTEECYIIKR